MIHRVLKRFYIWFVCATVITPPLRIMAQTDAPTQKTLYSNSSFNVALQSDHLNDTLSGHSELICLSKYGNDTLMVLDYTSYQVQIDTLIPTTSHSPDITILKVSLHVSDNLGEHGMFQFTRTTVHIWNHQNQHLTSSFLESYTYDDDYMEYIFPDDVDVVQFHETSTHFSWRNKLSFLGDSIVIETTEYSCDVQGDVSNCERAKVHLQADNLYPGIYIRNKPGFYHTLKRD